MTDTPRFKGAAVELGGETYTVPPLALGAVKVLLPRLQALKVPESGLPDAETLDFMLEVIAAALQRNYPAMDAAALADLVDLGNIGPLFEVVMGGSGLAPKEGAGGGPLVPVAPAAASPPSPSTGA